MTLQGVTGLDTLLSGGYINVQPDIEGKGKPQRHFKALKKIPVLDKTTRGLHLTLETDALGSLNRNSPVTFKQILVGYVADYQYNEATQKIDIHLFIEPEHAGLVKENSHFWNSSGFELTGSLASGIKLRTGSLAAIVSGGITFDHVNDETPLAPAKNGQIFPLHSDFESAEMGYELELQLQWDSGIDRDAAIIYQGVTLGRIVSFSFIDGQARKIIAKAKVDPRVAPYLTEQAEFFVVAPQVDLGGVTNLHSLLLGSHIEIRPSVSGEKTTFFQVYNQKPAYQYSEPGLHLVLQASDVGSFNLGTGIYYKQQKVGSVQAVENIGPDNFLIHIHVLPEYEHYVSTDSHFWHASGLRLKGGLRNFELHMQSVQAMLAGGIAFDSGIERGPKTGVEPAAKLPENGDRFQLFPNEQLAAQRITFELSAISLKGLSNTTRILYQGEQIGSIHRVFHQQGENKLEGGLLPQYAHVLTQDTQFWLVKPQLSLSGLADASAFFDGAYISLNTGESSEPKASFWLLEKPPAKRISAKGLQLRLSTEQGNIVSAGRPVYFKGIVVGQVDHAVLADSGSEVNMHITIEEKYRHLINKFTRFYNTSGITLSGGAGGFTVKTESANTLLMGGIAFYTPGSGDAFTAVEEGDHFTLFEHVTHARAAGLAITIRFAEMAGLKPNMKIKYQGQNVGFVERLIFNKDNYSVVALAFLNDRGRKFAVEGSKFWLAQTEIGLVGNKNIGTIIEGGFIGIMPISQTNNLGRMTDFEAEPFPPVVERLPYGLNLQLSASRLGSIRVGNPVLYRQVKVGQVIGIGLGETADNVDVFINISERYAALVTSRSKFWNTSGFNIEAGLFSGVKIDSESMQTLLGGGIAFATPEAVNKMTILSARVFVLHDKVKKRWQKWQPKIVIER